jgi:hypothetical protein
MLAWSLPTLFNDKHTMTENVKAALTHASAGVTGMITANLLADISQTLEIITMTLTIVGLLYNLFRKHKGRE